MLHSTTASSDQTSAIAVRVEDVTKTYGSPRSEVRALCGVSLEVRRGERVALLGKSGSGKSTLLNLIGGLDRPSSGRISAGGKDLAAMTGSELAAYRSTAVGMIFQAYNLIVSRTAIENVELPMILAGRDKIGTRTSGPRRPRIRRPGPETVAPPVRAFRRRAPARGHRPRTRQPP